MNSQKLCRMTFLPVILSLLILQNVTRDNKAISLISQLPEVKSSVPNIDLVTSQKNSSRFLLRPDFPGGIDALQQSITNNSGLYSQIGLAIPLLTALIQLMAAYMNLKATQQDHSD